jgi:hypothetical protein
MDPYDYTFKFFIGKNGEYAISGECEFDTDNKMTYKIDDTSDPLPAETLASFNEYMNLMKKIYDSSGGFKQMTVKLKNVV